MVRGRACCMASGNFVELNFLGHWGGGGLHCGVGSVKLCPTKTAENGVEAELDHGKWWSKEM